MHLWTNSSSAVGEIAASLLIACRRSFGNKGNFCVSGGMATGRVGPQGAKSTNRVGCMSGGRGTRGWLDVPRQKFTPSHVNWPTLYLSRQPQKRKAEIQRTRTANENVFFCIFFLIFLSYCVQWLYCTCVRLFVVGKQLNPMIMITTTMSSKCFTILQISYIRNRQ